MMVNPVLKIIRAKKLGVLIRDVRMKSGKSLEECAQAMGLSAEDLAAMEYGQRPPTLPELEILAYYLEVPLEHFWQSSLLITDGSDKQFDAEEIKQLRQASIGELLRKARTEAALTVEQLAENSGIEPANLQAYEEGGAAIPLPELEAVAQALNNPLSTFEDQTSLVGSYFAEQKNMRQFLDLPAELKEFIGKPVNQPYIELAIRLSELKVEKLRALAEGLLEITL
ncbi:MAG: helix-turn-helix domain-containing protein [Acidobacteriaceae bacterium]